MIGFTFPLWLRIAHFVNFLFLTLLIRSGIQILADHPMLYGNDHCIPGSEWVRFGRKKSHKDKKNWTSSDEEINISSWMAIPGGKHNLGLGRHWHFFSVLFWVLNGLVYVVLLFATGNWPRLIPTHWSIFPEAWKSFVGYLTLHPPPPASFHPYDGLQQLSYAFVVFILGPLAILTGAAMSPAISGRFPHYTNLFGGRQKARSLHFLVLVAYVVFIIIHVTMVAWVDFPGNMNHIVLGESTAHKGLAIVIGLLGIGIVIAVHVILTVWSQRKPRQVQHLTGIVIDKTFMAALQPLQSRQDYSPSEISPYFWVNGNPPESDDWKRFQKERFQNWTLKVFGLMERPDELSLMQLKAMPQASQITRQNCIQGWTGIAQWKGVHLQEILKEVQPKAQARYVVFYSFQTDENGLPYYSSLTLREAHYPQTILAYEMNGLSLPIEHGAPIRLRVETKLGFKMTKWIKSIELVDDLSKIGKGQGGYREDEQFFDVHADI
jgi:DMSO/TMAO reductase YedYZ molybdopterin-dependent catalytic subunit/thiosulfate reductase cytochrome b subunit